MENSSYRRSSTFSYFERFFSQKYLSYDALLPKQIRNSVVSTATKVRLFISIIPLTKYCHQTNDVTISIVSSVTNEVDYSLFRRSHTIGLLVYRVFRISKIGRRYALINVWIQYMEHKIPWIYPVQFSNVEKILWSVLVSQSMRFQCESIL
jgi:hypothetical protein